MTPNTISIPIFNCKQCSLPISDESFYKDKNGQPMYFHMLNKDEGVMFCGPQHSSDWALENKDKIWDRDRKKM